MFIRQLLNGEQDVPVGLPVDATLPEAAALLAKMGLVVVWNDRQHQEPVGIVTDRTIVESIARHGTSACGLAVGAIMNRDLVMCRPEHELTEVIQLMLDRRRRHLPVTEGGRLVGILNIHDALRSALDEHQLEEAMLREYFLGLGYT